MSEQPRSPSRTLPLASAIAFGATLAVLGGMALAQQDKYALRVPGGLAFSEFRGYENWEVVSVSLAEDVMAVIVANPEMIEAYKSGIPGNGQPFPDGAKTAKIHWKLKKSADAPAPTSVPDVLHDVDFMVRDSKRFANTNNWGYAQFNYNVGSDAFSPEGTGADCGAACHTIVSAKDYVFTAYQKK